VRVVVVGGEAHRLRLHRKKEKDTRRKHPQSVHVVTTCMQAACVCRWCKRTQHTQSRPHVVRMRSHKRSGAEEARARARQRQKEGKKEVSLTQILKSEASRT
jgi:hypothetical protein